MPQLDKILMVRESIEEVQREVLPLFLGQDFLVVDQLASKSHTVVGFFCTLAYFEHDMLNLVGFEFKMDEESGQRVVTANKLEYKFQFIRSNQDLDEREGSPGTITIRFFPDMVVLGIRYYWLRRGYIRTMSFVTSRG